MNDDRDTRDQELSTGDGNKRPGQVDGQHLGSVPGDGAAADTESAGIDGQTQPLWHRSAGPAFGPGTTQDGPPIVTGETDGNGSPPTEQARPRGNAITEPQRGRRRKRRPNMSWWVELPILLLFALVLALLIKSFVVQAFYIPSSSMENTLEIGDKVLVNKLVYDFRSIHRGDIVVFNGDGSWDPVPARAEPLLTRFWDSISGLFGTAPGVHDYIKRVIGVPGDHVTCCTRQGQITVNGVPLREKSYLYPSDSPSEQRFSITVPPGRLWVMGDHRSVSYDSRGHTSDPGNGTIPENHVVGRAFVIVAPISRWRILPIPATFQQPQLTASAAAAPGHNALQAPGASLLAALALPGAPAAAGLAAALPLTLAQRRIRRRLRGRWRRPHSAGSRDGPDGGSGVGPGGASGVGPGGDSGGPGGLGRGPG
jgi:signal peptidase I